MFVLQKNDSGNFSGSAGVRISKKIAKRLEGDFTLGLMISLVILQVNHEWTIKFWVQNLGSPGICRTPIGDGHLCVAGWSCWSPSIHVRANVHFSSAELGEKGGNLAPRPSPTKTEPDPTHSCTWDRIHCLHRRFSSPMILGPWCSTDVRNAAVIIQPDDGSCWYHGLCHGAGATQIRWTLWHPMVHPPWFTSIHLDSFWLTFWLAFCSAIWM